MRPHPGADPRRGRTSAYPRCSLRRPRQCRPARRLGQRAADRLVASCRGVGFRPACWAPGRNSWRRREELHFGWRRASTRTGSTRCTERDRSAMPEELPSRNTEFTTIRSVSTARKLNAAGRDDPPAGGSSAGGVFRRGFAACGPLAAQLAGVAGSAVSGPASLASLSPFSLPSSPLSWARTLALPASTFTSTLEPSALVTSTS